MRGDRPRTAATTLGAERFTPHARGSTVCTPTSIRLIVVYPACAGIDPIDEVITQDHPRLPRMRGDRPWFRFRTYLVVKFTPHARGSTFHLPKTLARRRVYPACAGIDRSGTH